MFRNLIAQIKKNRTKRFIENTQAWYKTCSLLTKTYGVALYDQDAFNADIGIMLDKTDRMLFQLDSYTSDALGFLRRNEPALANKVNDLSTQVFRLRNKTISFLLRSQGGMLFSGIDRGPDSRGSQAYYQALEEVGFTARQIHRELEKELTAIWPALRGPLLIAQQSLAA
jgi:hypothetical protein